MKKIFLIALVALLSSSLAGCCLLKKNKKSESEQLKEELAKKDQKIEELMNEKDRALETAKNQLEKDLRQELEDYKAKLEMTSRGLVITFLAEVFFEPGRVEIKQSGLETLQKVAAILNEKVPDSKVAIEGHTDADPIKKSGWKSNWELSSARALSVLHYFEDQCKVDPARLSAVGYGEYQPVADNATKEGKQKNRRVEIVIMPKEVQKVKTE